MEKTPKSFESSPSKETKYGSNVTINAVFIRHGEKELSTESFETVLSARGEEQSRAFGQSRQKHDAIKAYSSDTKRTKDTGKLASESAPTTKKMKQRVSSDLAFRYDPEGAFAIELTAMKKEGLGDDYDQQTDVEKNRRTLAFNQQATDHYLSFGEKRPDPKTASPVETAARVARRVKKYQKMATKLKSGSDIETINATHDFPIAAFLKETMVRDVDGQEQTGFDSVKEIGGPIEPTDHFELLIETDNNGEATTSLLFRGEKHQLDQERLEELTAIARDFKD